MSFRLSSRVFACALTRQAVISIIKLYAGINWEFWPQSKLNTIKQLHNYPPYKGSLEFMLWGYHVTKHAVFQSFALQLRYTAMCLLLVDDNILFCGLSNIMAEDDFKEAKYLIEDVLSPWIRPLSQTKKRKWGHHVSSGFMQTIQPFRRFHSASGFCFGRLTRPRW